MRWWLALAAVLILVVVGCVYALHEAAKADTPPPPIVVSTGGAVSGSSPGTGCQTRSGTVVIPHTTSSPYAWAEPDWPGLATVTAPVTGSGCSR